jgi:hypothetical protein
MSSAAGLRPGVAAIPALAHCSSGPVQSTVAQANHVGGSQPPEPAEVGAQIRLTRSPLRIVPVASATA